MSATMRAAVSERYHSVAVRDVPKPAPAEGQVLVRVHAAGVNPYDWHFLRGEPRIMRLQLGFRGPRLLVRGTDLAGVVESAGSRFAVGDRVYGQVEGAFADYVAAPEELLAPMPTNLTFEQAATVPLAATTAWQGLDGVQPGQRVLIHGASGGVGTFAVQIAVALGAEVTGVCSTRNLELVLSLGATRAIDYTTTDVVREPGRYDVVLDLGGRRGPALRKVLAPGGSLLLSSGEGGRWIGPLGRIIGALALGWIGKGTVRALVEKPSRAALAPITAWIEDGAVRPVVDRIYPGLRDAAEAIERVEKGHTAGKVGLTVI